LPSGTLRSANSNRRACPSLACDDAFARRVAWLAEFDGENLDETSWNTTGRVGAIRRAANRTVVERVGPPAAAGGPTVFSNACR
jgi:hypothetical protein